METIGDIVADMREIAKDPECVAPTGLAHLADRIEAAWKHDRADVMKTAMMTKCEICERLKRGNAAKMRNCDRYPTLAEAVMASGEASADAPGLNGMGQAQLVRFCKWLFAESEGGAK